MSTRNRSELANGMWDFRLSLIKHGLYNSENRRKCIEMIQTELKKKPKLFQKLNKRQEMAKAIWNTRRELQQQGLYTREVNQELSKYMEDQIKKYQGVFGKGAQK